MGRNRVYDNRVNISATVEKEMATDIKDSKYSPGDLIRLAWDVVRRHGVSAVEYRKREIDKKVAIKNIELIDLQKEIEELKLESIALGEACAVVEDHRTKVDQTLVENIKKLRSVWVIVRTKFTVKQGVWKNDPEAWDAARIEAGELLSNV